MEVTKYEITLRKEVFAEIFQYGHQEEDKNSLILKGNWYPEFVKMIQNTEQHQYTIKPTKGRLNPSSKKKNASFFSSSFVCKMEKCSCKYSINLEKYNENFSFLKFTVCRTGVHDHSSKQSLKQIRGVQRENVAQIVQADFKGSAKAFFDTMKGRGVSNIPTTDVIRKIISEMIHEDTVSTNWIINLMSASDMSKRVIKGDHFNGSVQSLRIFPDLTINLHTEQQIKCINYINTVDRMLHIDATGGLVKVDKQMQDYG